MMDSGMNEHGVLEVAATRRHWLAHCTALAAAAGITLMWPSSAVGDSARKTILVVGDSLSAEYGLKRGTGWVALLERRLAQRGIVAAVINASVSGDTTAGGRSRLAPLLRLHKPSHVIVELGGNDALRGLPLDMTRANLAEMVRLSRTAGARVLVAGMQVPPNYGRQYSDEFAALFAGVAATQNAALVPFLLKGVADGPQAEALFQSDRIHPTEAAHPIILDNVWSILLPLLK
jgi:acyl-CoA thioesterase-1